MGKKKEYCCRYCCRYWRNLLVV